jgi:hypothetical protein
VIGKRKQAMECAGINVGARPLPLYGMPCQARSTYGAASTCRPQHSTACQARSKQHAVGQCCGGPKHHELTKQTAAAQAVGLSCTISGAQCDDS